jgi:hypothetical protein
MSGAPLSALLTLGFRSYPQKWARLELERLAKVIYQILRDEKKSFLTVKTGLLLNSRDKIQIIKQFKSFLFRTFKKFQVSLHGG